MAIATPSPSTFTPSSLSCTTRSSSSLSSSSTRHQFVRFPSSSTRFPTRRLLTTTTTATCCLNSSNKPSGVSPDNGSSNGDVVLHRQGVAPPKEVRLRGWPVFVTLPVGIVSPEDPAKTRKRKVIFHSLKALAAAGVDGVVMEVWWRVVEREPGVYNWDGYWEIVSLAMLCGLKVRAVLAFHQFGSGPDDPHWYIYLPTKSLTPVWLCLGFSLFGSLSLCLSLV